MTKPSSAPELSRRIPIVPPENLRLLILSDSDADRALLLILMRKSGYVPIIECVENEECLAQALKEGNWNLVIARDRVPYISASNVARLVGTHAPRVPVIVISDETEMNGAIAALKAGADDWLTNASLPKLVPAIEQSLQAAFLREQQTDAEDSLRESESRLRALASNAPGMLFEVFLVKNSLQFSYVSDGSMAMIGIAPDELLKSPEQFIELLDPKDLASLLRKLRESLRSGDIARWQGQTKVRGGAGIPRWLQLSASLRTDGMSRRIWTGVMTDITALKSAEAELSRSRDELRGLSAHLTQARESERARIAREIHDDIGGLLTGLRADLLWLDRRVGSDDAIAEKLRYMHELVDSAAAASARIARDLRPAVLDFGFVSAMEWLTRDFHRHSGIHCEFTCNDEEAEVNHDCATAVFRIFQELLTNIIKHSHAKKVHAHLEIHETEIVLKVLDDGVGIRLRDRRRHESFGIRGMRERALELGGKFSIQPAEHGGSYAVLNVPRHGEICT